MRWLFKQPFDKNDYIRLDEISRTEKDIEKAKELITNLQDDFMGEKSHQKTSMK